MNHAVWGNCGKCEKKKHRDIKLVTAERQRSFSVSEPKFHTTKFFTENLLAIEMKKHKYTSKHLPI